MGGGTFKLPVIDDTLPNEIAWEEFAVVTPDSTDGSTLTFYLLILGYLTGIWLKTCTPVQGNLAIDDFMGKDEGEYRQWTISGGLCPLGQYFSQAIIDSVIDVLEPDDLYHFGFPEDPLDYLGKYGWGFAGDPLTGVPDRFLPFHWLDSKAAVVLPETPAVNLFWLALRPKVFAHVQIVGQENGFGAILDDATTFNPMDVNACGPPGSP